MKNVVRTFGVDETEEEVIERDTEFIRQILDEENTGGSC